MISVSAKHYGSSLFDCQVTVEMEKLQFNREITLIDSIIFKIQYHLVATSPSRVFSFNILPIRF